MLGISTYTPKFHTNAKDFKKEFEKIFSELIGKRIERFWLMWDTKEDNWLADGPIVLEIERKRYELTAYRLSEFSLTINSFELTDKLDWYGMGNEMPLIWKENGNPELERNLDKPIIGINILTYTPTSEVEKNERQSEVEDMLTGVEFILEKESESDNDNFFSIFNGLDQNALSVTEIQQNNQINRVKIIS